MATDVSGSVLARSCAAEVGDLFAAYNARFRAITQCARLPVETRDLAGARADAVDASSAAT
jgi:hypothetical protein